MTDILHTYHDGSILKRTTIQEVLKVQNWQGNRILNVDHAAKLAASIKDKRMLDRGYSMIVIDEKDADDNPIEQRYIVDGQHRMYVLKAELFLGDFPVTVTEKHVASEAEAIEYFNSINNSKPIAWKEDPSMIINRYVSALESVFNAGLAMNSKLIRVGRTVRPFLNIDDIRQALKHCDISRLKSINPADFVSRVREWNGLKVRELEVAVSMKPDTISEKCIARKFALAFYPTLPWLLVALR